LVVNGPPGTGKSQTIVNMIVKVIYIWNLWGGKTKP
jgi:hypothetical protein